MIGITGASGKPFTPNLIHSPRAQAIRQAGDADGHQRGTAVDGAVRANAVPTRAGPNEAHGSESVRADGRAQHAHDLHERKEVAQLQARDRQVRAHEAAHKAAGGRYTGAVSYDYSVGPDGRRYVTGGEVSIDASAVPGDPQSTIDKMEVVVRAALAPAQPSTQDRAVAARARQIAARARLDLMSERMAPNDQNGERPPPLLMPDKMTHQMVGRNLDIVG